MKCLNHNFHNLIILFWDKSMFSLQDAERPSRHSHAERGNEKRMCVGRTLRLLVTRARRADADVAARDFLPTTTEYLSIINARTKVRRMY
jgi:hypothetical protein